MNQLTLGHTHVTFEGKTKWFQSKIICKQSKSAQNKSYIKLTVYSCAVRKIKRSPIFQTYQIQVDQNVIFMLKLSFLVAQEQKKQKPPEAARAKHWNVKSK